MILLVRGLLDFGVTALVDEDGRPVAEVASPAFRSVHTDLVACPYADVRAGGVMNRSALGQMTTTWPDLLASFAALAGPRPTVSRAWAAAVTGIALPLVSATPVPRRTAALFKASLGLSQVFSALLLTEDGVADAPLSALGDAPAFFDALDQGRWLVGANQVCAGSRPMIEQAFDALAGRGVERAAPSEVVDAAARVGQLPPEVVGLHVAHLASLQQLHRVGQGPPVEAHHPWLRAVFAIPDRPAEHARRLFPTGGAPASLERYLALPLADRPAAFPALLTQMRVH